MNRKFGNARIFSSPPWRIKHTHKQQKQTNKQTNKQTTQTKKPWFACTSETCVGASLKSSYVRSCTTRWASTRGRWQACGCTAQPGDQGTNAIALHVENVSQAEVHRCLNYVGGCWDASVCTTKRLGIENLFDILPNLVEPRVYEKHKKAVRIFKMRASRHGEIDTDQLRVVLQDGGIINPHFRCFFVDMRFAFDPDHRNNQS